MPRLSVKYVLIYFLVLCGLVQAVAAKPASSQKPKQSYAIVFLGDSMTARGKWDDYFPYHFTINHGIGGNRTADVLHRIMPVVQNEPDKLFLMIGVNDLIRGIKQEQLLGNYTKILEKIKTNSPKTKVYVESVLPINYTVRKQLELNKGQIIAVNKALKSLAHKMDYTYLDVYSLFSDNDTLPDKYTIDGLHLNANAYSVWVNFLSKYVNE